MCAQNLTSANPSSGGHYETLIVGGGPAGLGPLVAASKQGTLHQLLDTGICLVEKQSFIGGGDLGNYAINSDTPGGVLLECFSDHNKEALDHLNQLSCTNTLKERDSQHVPLKLISIFLNELGSTLKRVISQHPASKVYLNSEVTRIDTLQDGSFQAQIINTNNKGTPEVTTVTAERIVLAPGGVQSATTDQQSPLFGTTTCIADFPGKTFLSSDQVLKNTESFQTLVSQIKQGQCPAITILGSSHSAFAVASFLFRQLEEDSKDLKVKILFRSEPKVFYPSANEAIEDGYTEFSQQDICVTTDRLFRFGGLRMESRELLRRVSGLDNDHSEPRLELVKFTNETDLRKILSKSDVIVSALGYKPRYMPMFDAKANPIEFGASNGKFVDQQCRIVDKDGKAIPNLYGIGLACGYVPDNGGEPSFRGQTNSIWIYQNPAGNILLEAMQNTQRKVYCERAS